MLKYICDHCGEEIVASNSSQNQVNIDVRGPFMDGPQIHLNLHIPCFKDRYGDVFGA